MRMPDWRKWSRRAELARTLAVYPALLAYLFAYERGVSRKLRRQGGEPPWKRENRPTAGGGS